MPLSFEREGLFGLSSSSQFFEDKSEIRQEKKHLSNVVGGVLSEPTSVLDSLSSPSPLTSSYSSSHGVTVTAGDDKCSQMGLGQEQDILRLIMDQGSGFGVFDPSFGFGSGPVNENSNPFPFQDPTNHCLFANPPLSPPAKRFNFGSHQPDLPFPDQVYDPVRTNPPAKRCNSGSYQPDLPFSDPVYDPVRTNHWAKRFNSGSYQPDLSLSDPVYDPIRRQHQQQQIPAVTISPSGMAGDDQSVIIEQLFNAAELIGTTGNNNNNNGDHIILAQGILARLNQHLNSNNNNHKSPFQRAVSHISEVLLSLIIDSSSQPLITPENLILRIDAYKSFSETSPFLQFVNFTSNQSILDSCNESRFDRIHIIDFDVGYGGQWPSLMQELAGRTSSLKLTVFAPPPATISDEFELRFTEENLKSFAGEVKIQFEIEFLSIELLLNPSYWPLSLRSSENEAIAVNLPLNSVISGYLPLILRFLKHISPNVVVCSNKGCDRTDAPFPNAVIHALHYQTTLLESLNQDDLSIERFWVQPLIEKVLMKRHRWIERTQPWRSLFTQCGFSPVSLSQTAVAQAECLVQRFPVRGYHVEKRQSSLVMCWHRNELVTVSTWKC